MVFRTPVITEGRRRRDTDSVRPRSRKQFNETVEFYLGFIQDGVTSYRDLRNSTIEELAFIIVIEDPPDLKKWEGIKEYSSGKISIKAGDALAQMKKQLYVLWGAVVQW